MLVNFLINLKSNFSRLKPLGLNLLLNTNCGVLKGKKRADQHRKSSSLRIHAKTKPARQCKFTIFFLFLKNKIFFFFRILILNAIYSVFMSPW
jgi:hypothetical protein